MATETQRLHDFVYALPTGPKKESPSQLKKIWIFEFAVIN